MPNLIGHLIINSHERDLYVITVTENTIYRIDPTSCFLQYSFKQPIIFFMIYRKLIALIITGIIIFATPKHVSAQLSKNPQLNFWIGKWDLYTNGSLFGESQVDTILNNFVIQEDFFEFPPDPFHGINFNNIQF